MICTVTIASASHTSTETRARLEQDGAVFTQPNPEKYPDLWEMTPFKKAFSTVDELAEWLRDIGEEAVIDEYGTIEIYNWYRE